LIFESDSYDIEHADDEPNQRPKWMQSILPTIDYLTDDLVDPRRMRSQFEGDPHALIAIKLVMPIHCYMVLASDPPAYAEAEGNLYLKTTMNEGDLGLLLCNKIKSIYADISLVHLLHQLCTCYRTVCG
jgi:hypothetical protein